MIPFPPESDAKVLLDNYIVEGHYRPEDAMSVSLSSQFSDDKTQQDAYWHEHTHLHLYTSTAFGYFQQAIAVLASALRARDVPSNFFSTIDISHEVLYEATWEIQEGTATITPYLLGNSFSSSMLAVDFYKHLPKRYANSSLNIATAVGALVPQRLRHLAYIVGNAIAQWALNAKILDDGIFFLESISDGSLSNSFYVFEMLSKKDVHPSTRLYALISRLYQDKDGVAATLVEDQFRKKIVLLDFVSEASEGLSINVRTDEEQLILQDALNSSVFDALTYLLPSYSSYNCVAEMQESASSLFEVINETGLVKCGFSSIDGDLASRVKFRPNVK